MKSFINNPKEVVNQGLEGLLTNANLTYLDSFPEIRVILKTKTQRSTRLNAVKKCHFWWWWVGGVWWWCEVCTSDLKKKCLKRNVSKKNTHAC